MSDGEAANDARDASDTLRNDQHRLRIGLCCQNCAFGILVESQVHDEPPVVRCHYWPPAMVGAHSMFSPKQRLAGADRGDDGRIHPQSVWPLVNPSGWCSQFTSDEEFESAIFRRFGPRPGQPTQGPGKRKRGRH